MRIERCSVVCALGLLGVFPGCGAIPEGRFACAVDGDCPAGWSCRDRRCFATSVASGDAAVGDSDATAGAGDGGPPDGADAGVPCRGSAECGDGNVCNGEERCLAGVCAPGTPMICDDADPCTTDACIPATGTCDHAPFTGACDDGSLCTMGDACTSGVCAGTPVACALSGSVCEPDGVCRCPSAAPVVCPSACRPQCCPETYVDLPNSCGPDGMHTSHCAADGVLICI